MTPFQRQVISAARSWEAEQKEQKRKEVQEQAGAGGQNRPRNGRAQGSAGGNSDLGQEETVRYINQQENPDHEVHHDDE